MAISDLAGGRAVPDGSSEKNSKQHAPPDDALPALLLSGAESSERWILEHGKVGKSMFPGIKADRKQRQRGRSGSAVSRNSQLERRFRF